MTDNNFKFTPQVLVFPIVFVLMMWIVFWAEVRFNLNLGHFGIYPRAIEGLPGIIVSPFIHGNLEHIYNNSLPLLVLLAALSYFYRELALKVVGYGILLSGLITWIIGRESFHIGASGLVYVLVSFIFFKGIITKYYRLVALSLMVILLYGSMVWYVFPDIEKGISWEGHLGGFVAGIFFALYFKTAEYKKLIRYDWEKPDFDPTGDKFLERFDENGNFVNPPPPPEPEEEFPDYPEITYRYVFKERDPASENP